MSVGMLLLGIWLELGADDLHIFQEFQFSTPPAPAAVESRMV